MAMKSSSSARTRRAANTKNGVSRSATSKGRTLRDGRTKGTDADGPITESRIQERTNPSQRDRQLRQTQERLEIARQSAKGVEMITVEDAGLTKRTQLPAAALEAAAEATALILDGKHARVIVVPEEISTSKAAEILGVSRPHFIGLLDAGHLPFRKSSEKETAHRYVKTDDVLDYQRRRAKAESSMNEYGAISEELGV
jgi:hypothetical protein